MSIVVSVRISPDNLAKALDGIKDQNLSSEVLTLADIVRTTFLFGLTKTCNSAMTEPTFESVQEIQNMTRQKRTSKKQLSLKQVSDLQGHLDAIKPTDSHRIQNVPMADRDKATKILAFISAGQKIEDNLNSSNEDVARITALLYPEEVK